MLESSRDETVSMSDLWDITGLSICNVDNADVS